MRAVSHTIALLCAVAAAQLAHAQQKIQLQGHDEKTYLRDIAFSPDGKLLASAAQDGSVLIWDASMGTLVKSLKCSDGIEHVEFSPSGRQLAAVQNARRPTPDDEVVVNVQLWDTSSWEKSEMRFAGKPGCRVLSTYLPGGDMITCFQNDAFGDSELQRWSPAGYEVQPAFTAKKKFFVSLTVSPDGNWLAGASTPGMLWRTNDFSRPRVIKGIFRPFEFSPDSQLLAGTELEEDKSDTRSRVVLWNVKDLREVGTLSGFVGYVSKISFSRDGRHLAAAATNLDDRGANRGSKVQVWDLTTGERRSLEDDTFCMGLSFSPTADVLASSFAKPSPGIRFWNSQTGEVAATANYGESKTNTIVKLIYSPKGNRIATIAVFSERYDGLCLWALDSQ